MKHRRNKFQPRLEALEQRDLLSATTLIADDFESGAPVAAWSEVYNSDPQSGVVAGVAHSGNYSFRIHYETDEGRSSLAMLNIPRSDEYTVSYWQMYPKGFLQRNLKQANFFHSEGTSNLQGSMILALWGDIDGNTDPDRVQLASSFYGGSVDNTTAQWVDFPIHAGEWFKTTFYVKFNTPGQADGVYRLWRNDTLVVERNDVVYRTAADGPDGVWIGGNYSGAGVNPIPFDRYIDDIVITAGEKPPQPALALSLSAAEVQENTPEGVLATVTRSGTSLATPLTVSLASSDRSEARVPQKVTIPAGQSSVTFRVKIVDDRLVDGTQTATITAIRAGFERGSAVLAVLDNEHPPVAQNDQASTLVNKAVTIPVLANDSDEDGNRLVVTRVWNVSNGRVAILTNGRVRYTPAPGFTGTATFNYQVSDRTGGYATGQVTVEVTSGRPEVNYVSFQGQTLTLQVWEGQRVAFLTSRRDLDPAVMARIVGTFDRAYNYYKAATGREPTPWGPTTYHAKSTIAVVAETCGAGCGYLGYTGIEIMPEYFDLLYDGVRQRNEYDQVLFYELGRNFWFWGSQLAPETGGWADSVTTGYAVFMRFLAMEDAGVSGGPFNGAPFATFRTEVEGMLDRNVADPSLDWRNTLAVGQAPANPLGLGATDLFASFLFRLRRDYGGETFVQRLWQELAALPTAGSTQDAVDNLVVAAGKAANRNLAGLFTQTWRWPVSATAQKELQGLP